jgi:hypothetical protein
VDGILTGGTVDVHLAGMGAQAVNGLNVELLNVHQVLAAGMIGTEPLASYNYGKGAFILNTSSFWKYIRENPAADRLLCNILNTEQKNL